MISRGACFGKVLRAILRKHKIGLRVPYKSIRQLRLMFIKTQRRKLNFVLAGVNGI